MPEILVDFVIIALADQRHFEHIALLSPAAFPAHAPGHPWRSYSIPSCGTCSTPVVAALRCPSPCAGARRRVLPRRVRVSQRGALKGSRTLINCWNIGSQRAAKRDVVDDNCMEQDLFGCFQR